MLKKLSLLLVLGVYLALLAEVFVRVLHPVKVTPRYVVSTDYGIRGNWPSVTYHHLSPRFRVRFDINSHGVRSSREIPYDKPDNTFRVVAFGDSFTMGYGANEDETYLHFLEQALKRKTSCDIEVINLAVSGHGTAEEIIALENEGVRYSPDLVLMQWHRTDLQDNLKSKLFKLDGRELVRDQQTYLPQVGIRERLFQNPAFRFVAGNSMFYSLLRSKISIMLQRDQFSEALAEAIDEENERGEDERVDDIPTALAIALIDRMHDTARDHGAEFAILDVPWKLSMTSFVTTFPEGSEHAGLVYSPLEDFAQHYGEELYWELPGGHFTPLGNRVVGEGLARRIEPTCGQPTGSLGSQE